MAVKKMKREDIVISPKTPKWLEMASVEDCYYDNDFYKIVLFFVIFSPCPRYCTKGRNLQYYGWIDKPWSTNKYLKDKLDRDVFTDKKKNFRCANKISELVDEIRKADLKHDFYLHRNTERVAFTKNETNEYMSLFHHIRCALAHGRFVMFKEDACDDIVFVMENGSEKGADFHVKARMILRKSTLLKWIDIITEGPKEQEKTYYKEVYLELLKDKKLRKKDLMVIFEESEYAINNAISFLKRANVISYQNHGKNSWWEVNISNANVCFDKLDN